MAGEGDPILHLVIVEESLNEAERYVSILRSAGHAVRPARVDDAEGLRELLSAQPADLVLATDGAPALDPAEAVAVLADMEKDVPVVAVLRSAGEPEVVRLMEAGVRAVVARGRERELCLVVARELAALTDRRALRRAERRYRELERRNRALLDSSRDAIAYAVDGMHVYANRAWLELFGYASFDEIEGLPLLDLIAPRDHDTMKRLLRAGAAGEPEGEVTVHGRRADGDEIPLTLAYAPSSVDGEPCLQIVIRPPQPEAPTAAVPGREDPLTGLLARQAFIEALEEAASAAVEGGAPVALASVGLDGVDAIARTVGIDAVDAVLQAIAGIIRSQVPADAPAGRIADTEVAVLLPAPTPEAAEGQAERLLAALSGRVVEVDGRGAPIAASIGLALVSEEAGGAREILRRAGEALHTAREAGGGRVVRYRPPAPKEDAGSWRERIAAAVEEGRVGVVYQPLSPLHGPPESLFEAYARLLEEGETVPAGRFLGGLDADPVAARLDRAVATAAIRALAAEHDAGRRPAVFLNLSAASLVDESYLPWLAGELRAAHLAAGAVILEVMEPAVVAHLAAARRLANGLRAAGCRLAIGRFGGGLGSLGLLEQLPVQFVKIDPSFLRELAGEGRPAIARICERAREAGVRTVAERVEDAMALPILWECGVDYVQGHFLQEPSEELVFDAGEGADLTGP
ncbi:EAL domain-containing response regulator [Inmirania thermothiophila]|uniref:PAS domain S-box-containing protein/diguanylate cyclase (GGDEF)-like protein n=1 Tax=Inmirania thermothiophila TaxID=1750597 RepID=A0A3N1Y9L3_9GAMM|nr:EAL domain-containing protein [Inmirania thermothiophila]ROR35178.1 PAS domain S-box-containing protein/diguanylate cyclase (GGDEF)-like protein [Inmirania thermothiophila]